MMVSRKEEKMNPVLATLQTPGFDPTQKHRLQSCGTGWQSAAFLAQEHSAVFGAGGISAFWDKTNIEGLYAAGDQLYASDCWIAALVYMGRRQRQPLRTTHTGGTGPDGWTREGTALLPLFRKGRLDWRSSIH